MRFLGLNGILSDGSDSTDLMGAEFEAKGYDFLDVDLPVRGVWSARKKTKEDTARLLDVVEPGDSIYAHSRGGLVVAEAMKHFAFRSVFLFRPAMSRNYQFTKRLDQKIYCIHSYQDIAIIFWSTVRF